MFAVTRQVRWPDGDYTVEISEGLDYAGPDALVPRYTGEMQEYEDPREAVKSAIDIAQLWQKDAPQKEIRISMGRLSDLELTEDSFKLLHQHADQLYEGLPKCDNCGGLLPKRYYTSTRYEDTKFCREYCVEKFIEEQLEWECIHE